MIVMQSSPFFITDRFTAAVEFVLEHETVFSPGHFGDFRFAIPELNPGDAGGLTKFGIDQRSHPNVNISALTFDDAVLIYLHRYWLPSRAGDFPAGYGEVIFDIRVNGGNGPALLQAGLHSIGCDVGTIDGIVGPKTKSAMAAAGEEGLRAFLLQREARYYNLAEEHHQHRRFLQGWLNRNRDLAKFVGISNL